MKTLEKTRCGEVDDLTANYPPPTITCPKCGLTKPRADFKRFLSPSQARQVGYTGGKRVQITSSICKTCRPKRKPASKLTKKALINRVQGGDYHPLVVQDMLTRRQQVARRNMAEGVSKAWDAAREATWDVPCRERSSEASYIRGALNYRSKTGPHDLVIFLTAYTDALNLTKAEMARLMYAESPSTHTVAPYTDWPDYCPQQTTQDILDLWASLPASTQRLLKRTPFLIHLATHPSLRRAPPAKPLRPARKETKPRQEPDQT